MYQVYGSIDDLCQVTIIINLNTKEKKKNNGFNNNNFRMTEMTTIL